MQDIKQFFTGKTVFVTGGSGFLGKVLIEKLLRSCPGIERIYVLMRGKKNVSGEERLKKITDMELFDRLKREQPNALSKLKCIYGDVTLLKLGLSEEDRKTLIEEVNVVFHGAASVRFDDRLVDAILMNTRGAREIANLALEMKQTPVLVHVSTTYCNPDKKVIEEVIYPPHADWRRCIQLAEEEDGYTLDILTQKFIQPQPNTYTFTKQLAEHVVKDLCEGKIPTIIYRPSIVISTLSDPMPGWVDNFNGPVGLLVASGKGIVRTAYGDPKLIADYCSVDAVIKFMIIAVWNKIVSGDTSEVTVYNASSSKIRYMRFEEVTNMGIYFSHDIPLENQLWFPGGGITMCYPYFYIKFLLCQLLPALVIDSILRILGKKPILCKVQRRIFIAYTALEYFIINEWDFKNDKCLALNNNLLPSDVDDFFLNIHDVDVIKYFRDCFIGVKKYLLKEKMENLENARFRAKCMYVLSVVSKVAFYFWLIWYVTFKKDVLNVLARSLINYWNGLNIDNLY